MNGASLAYLADGNCKKQGHQYQWVDEASFNAYPGQTVLPPSDLKAIYGGLFVKHVFCTRCGDYRAIKIKASKDLQKFHKLHQLKS